MERHIKFSGYSFSHLDLARFIVIVSLTLCCIFITWFSLSQLGETLFIQIFYFPLLYTAYFYPRKGLYLAFICAVIYESLAYLYMVPSLNGVIYTTIQGVLFIGITALVAYFAEKVNSSEARFRSIFENSLLGIVLFDQNTFKIQLTNSYFRAMLGYGHEDLLQLTFDQLFASQDDRKKFFESLGSSQKISHFETQ